MLVTFLADLMRNPRLQKEFSEDPEATMKREGLAPQERESLLGRDREKLAEALVRELRLGGIAAMPAPWPAPVARVFSVTPSRARQGQVITVTASGAWFTPQVSFHLKLLNTWFTLQVSSVTGADTDHSSLSGTLTLPSDAPVGRYGVYAENPEQGSLFPLPNAFEIIPAGGQP